MNLRIQADPPPLYETADRVVRVSGTRIPLERIIYAFLGGSTPEQIAQDYDSLSIQDVYAVISFYLRHRAEVDAYLADAEEDAVRTRREIEQQCNPAEIRARLLARRSGKMI